jgi:hypothetical protein
VLGTLEKAREDLIELVQADFEARFPGVLLVHDNAPVNWNNLPDYYVEFEIEFDDGEIIGVGNTPPTRVYGCIHISAHRREGLGTRKSLEALDWFADKLNFRQTDFLELKNPRPDGKSSVKGWHSRHLSIPFISRPIRSWANPPVPELPPAIAWIFTNGAWDDSGTWNDNVAWSDT